MLSVFQSGPNETLADLLNRLQAAVGNDQRDDFLARFETALGRLEKAGGPLRPWEQDNLLSALGAASVQEYELAIAFVVATGEQSPMPAARHFRREPLALASLRRRFERLRAA
jgi:hypothetical protein